MCVGKGVRACECVKGGCQMDVRGGGGGGGGGVAIFRAGVEISFVRPPNDRVVT